jgi:signal transduction histidine kinase
MIRSLIAKLPRFDRSGGRSDQLTIAIAFLIISAGIGVLAWRSYHLSKRMERGANTLAVQYAGYAAEITARRVDAAVRAEIQDASEEWQQNERKAEEPDFDGLRAWIEGHDWIVSAIYVPDFDPTRTIFVSEIAAKTEKTPPRMTQEFFTPTGTVKYTYDPARLLAHVHSAVRQQPLVRTSDEIGLNQRAEVSLEAHPAKTGLLQLPEGFAFISPLSAPLSDYAVRTVVKTAYAGSGWANQRVVSLWVSLLALVLTGFGAYLALRGMRREAETTKVRSALIANVSHELRTPLALIRLGAETLQRATKLKENERREIEDSILKESLHLSNLVENVLDVARIQHRKSKALALVPVQPRDLVTSLVASYDSWIRSKGFTVSMHIDEGIEEQMWDREAVSRALLNLVDNAIKYSADETDVEVALLQTDDEVLIEVHDHGVGIAEKELKRIFQPYYRARFSDTQTRRGAGLGLTLVQQIMAAHGGKVEVESEPGEGSIFRLRFPRQRRESREPGVAHEKLAGDVVRT